MNSLNIKLSRVNSKFKPYITVDGDIINCKKNQFGTYEASVQTEKTEVEVVIYRYLELQSKFWFLYAIISFFVSILGIFEPFYDKRCIVIDCKYNVKLNEQSDLKIQLNNVQDKAKATNIESNCDITEITNVYQIDKVAKKRWKIMFCIKLLLWIVAIGLTIYFIVNGI